jgi:nucleoside-diphosphate-sugar epimerase
MKIFILGGGGMIGQKLAKSINLGALGGVKEHNVVLLDVAFQNDVIGSSQNRICNVSEAGQMEAIARERPDLIFHLASVVSGQAETDFDLGWNVNFHPTWRLLEALKQEHFASSCTYRPKLVFTSSIAVFGGPYPELITDDFLSAPQTSYGAQKSICEALIGDFSRKGFIDGISMRLPTICVRPGKANLAASSFFSSIIREPLNGIDAILPVSDTVRHWHASPKSAVNFLIHASLLDLTILGNRRAINLPGISCTVAEQIEALRSIAGQDVVNRIKVSKNPEIEKIVEGWPQNFQPKRSLELGFIAEKRFSEIINVYIDEDFTKL